MLYERWRQVANDFKNEIALFDLASGERWTFAQLASRAESEDLSEDAVVFPQGNGPQFVFSVLNAWRSGKIVMPLEAGKVRPVLKEFPKDCVHLKVGSALPRMVAFRAEQFAADAANIVSTMQLQQDAPNVAVISLAHPYGFSNLVLPLLLHGIPLALIDPALQEMVHHAAEQLQKITLPAVPTLWQKWLDGNVIPKNVQLAVSSTAPLPLQLEQEIFSKCGIKIHNFYSLPECGAIAFDRIETPRSDVRLVGERVENVLLYENQNGCLEIGGAAVGETYWPEPSDTLDQGRFVTSDLAVVRDSNVYLLGGANDQITVAGQKISPEAIEAALLAHSGVSESLVFGVPDNVGSGNETIVACLSVRARITGKMLRQFLLQTLPSWKVPREWWFVNSLRTTDGKKLSRSECRENYLKNKSAADPTWRPS